MPTTSFSHGSDTSRGEPRLFEPFHQRDVTLRNRIVVSPMCQYSCEGRDGLPTPWHLVHLGAFAAGGTGLVFTEATAVTLEGRISPQDLGLWSDLHAERITPTVQFVHSQGAAMGVQLAHAGRKASTLRPWEQASGLPAAIPEELGGWITVGPTNEAHASGYPRPEALRADEVVSRVIRPFRDAADRALRAGFDVVEIHAAHGYLLHQFYSPLSNQRSDRYGGTFENRTRLTIEVVDAIRQVWPASKPLWVRISATDWVPSGWDLDQSVRLAVLLREHGVDLVDTSSAGVSPLQEVALSPGYQVPFAARIRREASIATGAVGLITEAGQADEIIRRGDADVVLLAREMLRDPRFAWHAARELGVPDLAHWPNQYVRARRTLSSSEIAATAPHR